MRGLRNRKIKRKRQKFKACMMQWPYLIKLIKEKQFPYCEFSIAKGEISRAFYKFQVYTYYSDCTPYPIKTFLRADCMMKVIDGKLELWVTHRDKL